MARYTQKAFPRHERKLQVVRLFSNWHAEGDVEPRTMGKIARALGLTPSPHFRDILLEMETEGDLSANPPGSEGSHTIRYYSLVRSLITEKYGNRRVYVKRQGQVIGTLEVPSGQLGLWS